MKTRKIIFILSLILSISCGGGGGDNDSSGGASSSVFKSCGMENGPLRIMPIGDSVTEAEAGHNSYRLNLWDKLLVAGCDIDFVGSRRGVSRGFTGSGSTNPPNINFDLDHESYWGRRTDEVFNFSQAAIAAHRPHLALIHLGTNDAVQDQSPTSTIDELSRLIDSLRAQNPEVRILLAQVIPTQSGPERVFALNALIPDFANAKSTDESPVIVIDQAAGYSGSADNYDGLHPDPGGEEKLAQKWFDGIMNVIDFA